MSWGVCYSTQWDWCAKTRVVVPYGSSLFLPVVSACRNEAYFKRAIVLWITEWLYTGMFNSSINQSIGWLNHFQFESCKLFSQEKHQAPRWTLVQLLMVVAWQEQSQDQRSLDQLIHEEGKVKGAVRQFSQECSRHVQMPLPFQGNHGAHVCMF